MSSEPSAHRVHVTIISNNAETIDGLETYLRGAGLTTYGTRRIEQLPALTPRAASAVVLFPDDFEREAVHCALAVLRLARPQTLRVLVTHDPRAFSNLPPTVKGALPPIVVPKPAWGFTILDAVRAGISARRSQAGER